MMEAFILSLGIAIPNFPEGAIISMLLKSEIGMKKGKAFSLGMFSEIVAPLAALCMFFLADIK